MSIDPTRFYSQQQQQRGDWWRNMMNMFLMMKRMKGQRELEREKFDWTKQLGQQQLDIYKTSQQALQQSRQAQYDLATFELEQARKKQEGVMALINDPALDDDTRMLYKSMYYTGQDIYGAKRRRDLTEAQIRNAEIERRRLNLDYDRAKAYYDKYGFMPPEFLGEIYNKQKEELNNASAPLLKILNDIPNAQKPKDVEKLQELYKDTYKTTIQTHPEIARHPELIRFEGLERLFPGADFSEQKAPYEGKPSMFAAWFNTWQTAKDTGDDLKKAEQRTNFLQKIFGAGEKAVSWKPPSTGKPPFLPPSPFEKERKEPTKKVHPGDIADDLMKSKGMDEYQLLEDLRKLIDPNLNTPELIIKNVKNFKDKFGIDLRQIIGYLEFRKGIPPQARQ